MIQPTEVTPATFGGTQRLYFFPNGYGASVVNSAVSYGTEMAVLRGTIENWQLCYETPITDDVIGYLDETEVQDLLRQIEALPGGGS
jgi:hypothetical protein